MTINPKSFTRTFLIVDRLEINLSFLFFWIILMEIKSKCENAREFGERFLKGTQSFENFFNSKAK